MPDLNPGQAPAGRKLYLLLAACFAVRALPAFLVYGTVDVDSWLRYANAIAGGDLLRMYANTHINWPPLVPWLSYFTALLSECSGLPFWGLIKIPAILSDCAITAIIYRALTLRGDGGKALAAASFYAFNPVSILVSGVHGQFDPLAIMFSAAAWYAFEYHRAASRTTVSALLLGLGILTKGFPVIFLPFFLFRLESARARALYLAAALAPAALALFPYLLATPAAIAGNVLGYASRFGDWGYILLLNVAYNASGLESFKALSVWAAGWGRLILLAAFPVIYYRAWKGKSAILDGALTLLLAFYCLTSGFGIQYLSWILPFAVLKRDRGLGPYTILAALWMLLWYLHIISPSLYALASGLAGERLYWRLATLSSLSAWIYCLLWFRRNIKDDRIALAWPRPPKS